MTFPSSSTSVSTVASTSTDDTPNINFTVDLAPALTDSEVDEAIARAVYSSAVPLSMLESQFWKKKLSNLFALVMIHLTVILWVEIY